MTTVASPSTEVGPFPIAQVETCLRAELIEAIKAEASIKGVSLPDSPAGMAKASIPIDSLVAVSILCAVESIVGFELPESVVRTGGYVSLESALRHLTEGIERQWTRRKGASHD